MNDEIVGIDLGTTNSLIGVMEAGFPILLADANGARLTPSVVHFPEQGEPLVGTVAARMRALEPRTTVYSAKRLIGWGSSDYWSLVRTRFFSNVLAELTIVPLIVTWAACIASAGQREARPPRYVEAAALFTGLLLICVLVFDLPHQDAHSSPA